MDKARSMAHLRRAMISMLSVLKFVLAAATGFVMLYAL